MEPNALVNLPAQQVAADAQLDAAMADISAHTPLFDATYMRLEREKQRREQQADAEQFMRAAEEQFMSEAYNPARPDHLPASGRPRGHLRSYLPQPDQLRSVVGDQLRSAVGSPREHPWSPWASPHSEPRRSLYGTLAPRDNLSRPATTCTPDDATTDAGRSRRYERLCNEESSSRTQQLDN